MATVFIDVNGDGKFNDGEPVGVSDGTGHYLVIGNGVGTLIAFGGTNLDTGLPNTLTLMAPVGSTAVNPLTTVVTALVSSGLTVAQANAALVQSLGLPAGTDLTKWIFLRRVPIPRFSFLRRKWLSSWR